MKRRGALVVTMAAAVLGFGGCRGILGIDEPRDLDAGSCLRNSDCPHKGDVCLFRVCSVPCLKDNDCPGGQTCLKTKDGAACTTSSAASCSGNECPALTRCSDGVCRTLCGDGASACLEDQRCVNGVCLPRGHDAGAPDAPAPPTPPKKEAGPPDAAGEDGAAPIACAARTVDAAAGLFVGKSGQDVENCGSVQSPCLTIQYAIDRANLVDKTRVYVAASRTPYVEALRPVPGIRVEGGWGVVGETWSPVCPGIGSVRIKAPAGSDYTVWPVDPGDAGTDGTVELAYLTVESIDAADVAPGMSVYGIFATGANLELRLDHVAVEVANAGDGTAGTPGTPGMPGRAPSSCPPGDGVTPPAARAGSGALPGTFARDGYHPSAAKDDAEDGTDGHDGTPAPSATCGDCGMDLGFGGCFVVRLCGNQGVSGCGGGAGGKGGPGTSGGSSIALYLWDAHATIIGGSLSAGDGGQGGDGGSGGPGGAGTLGIGTMQPCGDCQPIELGGQPGGNGSAGGRGGRGGGGAGGDAFAIFLGGAAAAARSGVTLAHGVAGRGGNTVVLLPDGGVGDAGLEAGTGTGGAGEAGLDGGPDGGVRRGLFGAPGVARDVGP